MRFLPVCVAVMLMVNLFIACREENKLEVAKSVNPKKLPTLSTKNVLTYISDSGFTKFKIVTPLWNVYNETEEPYWDFPEGVYLRQLDHQLEIVATIAADSAKYFTGQKRWELYGNVEIEQKGKTFFSSQRMFFDDRNKQIYSDTFIHIETPTQILEGMGFTSNLEMTRYSVLKPTGVFPMDQKEMTPMAAPMAPPSLSSPTNDSVADPQSVPPTSK